MTNIAVKAAIDSISLRRMVNNRVLLEQTLFIKIIKEGHNGYTY